MVVHIQKTIRWNKVPQTITFRGNHYIKAWSGPDIKVAGRKAGVLRRFNNATIIVKVTLTRGKPRSVFGVFVKQG